MRPQARRYLLSESGILSHIAESAQSSEQATDAFIRYRLRGLYNACPACVGNVRGLNGSVHGPPFDDK
jgi:hypothetical protein